MGRFRLKHVKYENRNYNLCLKYLNRSVDDFEYIPENILDQEMCYIAIKKGVDISYIPDKFRDRKIYEIAISKCYYVSNIIRKMKKEYYDGRMKIFIIKENPYRISFFEKSDINKKMCEIAFKDTYSHLIHFPKRFLKDDFFIKNYSRLGYLFEPMLFHNPINRENIIKFKIRLSYYTF
jgi:hypothetical protein